MIENLKEYVKQLWKEYDECLKKHFKYELMINDNDFYRGQAFIIRTIIYDLNEIIKGSE